MKTIHCLIPSVQYSEFYRTHGVSKEFFHAPSYPDCSLRMIQPLARIDCGPANVWGFPEWTREFSAAAPGPVTSCIQKQVMALLPRSCVK